MAANSSTVPVAMLSWYVHVVDFNGVICSSALSEASALVNLIFLHISRDMNKLSVTTSYMVSIGLSVGTNIVATLLIGYMYW